MTGACCRTGLHVFRAFDDIDEGAAVAAQFFASGAAAGDSCLFYGDAPVGARIFERLFPGELPAAARVERFIRVAPCEVFDGHAAHAVGALIALRDGLVRDAMARGCGVRMAMMPAADAPDGKLWDRTDALESMFIGRTAPPGIVTGLCLYDRHRYTDDVIELACAAHPWRMANGKIVRNAFHDGLLNPRGTAEHRVA